MSSPRLSDVLMGKRIELCGLHHHPAAALTMGDDGRHKTLTYGGVLRDATSSYNMKYSMRKDATYRGMLSNAARRTQFLAIELPKRMSAEMSALDMEPFSPDVIDTVVRAALAACLGGETPREGKTKPKKNQKIIDRKTSVQAFLSDDEIDNLSSVLVGRLPELLTVSQAYIEAFDSGESKAPDLKKLVVDIKKVYAELGISISSDVPCIDIALFGRRFFSEIALDVEGAVSIGKPFSTHVSQMQTEIFVTGDDLNDHLDNHGMAHKGAYSFTSCCLFREGIIDLSQLAENLNESLADSLLAVEAGVLSFFTSLSGSGRHRLLNDVSPSMVSGVVVSGSPAGLSGAFDPPVEASRERGMEGESVRRLGNRIVGVNRGLEGLRNNYGPRLSYVIDGVTDDEVAASSEMCDAIVDVVHGLRDHVSTIIHDAGIGTPEVGV